MAEAVRKPRQSEKTRHRSDIEDQIANLPVERHELPEPSTAGEESSTTAVTDEEPSAVLPDSSATSEQVPTEEAPEEETNGPQEEPRQEDSQVIEAAPDEEIPSEPTHEAELRPSVIEASSAPAFEDEEEPAPATALPVQAPEAPCEPSAIQLPPLTTERAPTNTRMYPSLPQTVPMAPVVRPVVPAVKATAPQEASSSAAAPLIHQSPVTAMKSSSSEYQLPPLERMVDDPPPLPQPLSEVQLHQLYRNPLVEQAHKVENRVLQMRNHEMKHELYQLLCEYKSALERNVIATQRLTDLIDENKRLQAQIWTVSREKGEQQGRCGDKSKVFATYDFTVAKYHEDMMRAFVDSLKNVKEHLDGERSTAVYAVAVSKLRIEHYIHQLFVTSPRFREIAANSSPRVHFGSLPPDDAAQIQRFNECIAVLFAFLRQPLGSKILSAEVQTWLLLLAGALIRTGRSEDHFFLLCHILRAPASFGEWAACLVQPSIPAPTVGPIPGGGDMAQAFFDFTYAVLACILQPIRDREQFLGSFHIPGSTEPSRDKGQQESWELVDSDGEDMEDESVRQNEGWHRVNESDIVALLQQVPLSPMYQHLLFTGTIQGTVTDASLLTSLSCAHQLLRLFEQGVKLYLKRRYANVIKRICKLIKHNLQFFTDHMELTMTHVLSSGHHSSTAQQWVPRVHSQYEQLARDTIEVLVRVTQRVPHGDHAWQFLAECPFRLLTVQSKRVLLQALRQQLEVVTTAGRTHNTSTTVMVATSVSAPSVREVVSASPNTLFLLTTLANLARECRFDLTGERRIIHSVVDDIFQLCFIREEFRESHAKTGRDLLTTIFIIHPHLIAYILDLMHHNMDKLGATVLFLAREMPFHLFVPSMETFNRLSDWLIKEPATSVSNQLARRVISLFNWGYHDDDPTRLFIPIELHRHAAILVVQAFKAQTTPKQAHWLVEEGSKLVTGMWTASGNTPQMAEQSFHFWCLEFVGRLRLHRASSLRYDIQVAAPASNSSPQHTSSSTAGSGGNGNELPVTATEWLSLTEEQCNEIGFPLPKDLNVNTSPVTLYVALLMTEWGNDIPGKFMEYGLPALELLINTHYQYRLGLEALLKVVQVAGHYNNLLWNNERFRQVLRVLLHGDDTYSRMLKLMFTSEVPSPVLTTFTAMMLNCCEESDRFAGWTVTSMCQFWLRCLLGIPNWYQDVFVLHAMEALLTLCHRLRICMLANPAERAAEDPVYALLQSAVDDYYQQQIAAASQRSGFSALMNLGAHLPCFYQQVVPPSPGTVVLPPAHFSAAAAAGCTCWPWLSWYLMRAEMFCEEKWGIWGSLQVTICKAAKKSSGKKSVDIQKCLTKVVKKLKFPLNYALDRVSIYLILKTILRIPVEHPVLALLVQLFFARFFELPSTRDNSLNGMGSNGIHLFDSRDHTSLLKSLRTHLSQCVTHYTKRLQEIQKQTQTNGNEASAPGSGSPTGGPSGATGDRRPTGSRGTISNSTSVGFQRIPLPLSPEGGSFGSRTPPTSPDFVVDEAQVVWYLAKMMETFVLWLDETRLHTLSLQLEALPSQYNSFRLHQLRNNSYSFWVDLVDPIVLNATLDDLIRPWRKRFVEDDALRRMCRVQILQNRVPTQEKLQARFERQQEAKAAPEFSQPSAVVEEISPQVLRDHIQLSRKIEVHVDRIRQHVRTHTDRAGRHGVLDAAIVDFLNRLYVKRKVTETYQVPCSLGQGLNRTRTCKAPASIAVKYDTFEIRPDIQTAVDANRTSWTQTITEAKQPLSQQLMLSVLTLEDIVYRLCSMSDTKPPARIVLPTSLYPQVPYAEYQKCAVAMFYQLTEQCREDWLAVPLCRALFTTIMQQIGMSYLHSDATQSQPLLNLILQHGHLTPLLVDFFNPLHADPAMFCHMYAQLTSMPVLENMLRANTNHNNNEAKQTTQKVDTKTSRIAPHYSLLHRFDVSKWLPQTHPDLRNREKLAELVVTGLQQWKSWVEKVQKPQSSPSSSAVSGTAAGFNELERQHAAQVNELLMTHLSAVLTYEYPSLLPKMTVSVLKCTSNQSLDCECIDVLIGVLQKDQETTGELSFPIDFVRGLLQSIASLLRDIDNGDTLFTAWSTAFDRVRRLLQLLSNALWFKLSRGLQTGQFHPRQTCLDFLTGIWEQTLNFWLLNPLKHQPPSNWDPNRLKPLLDLAVDVLNNVFSSLTGVNEAFRGVVLEFAWSWYHGCFMATLTERLGRSAVASPVMAGGQLDAYFKLLHSTFANLPWAWWTPHVGALLATRQLVALNMASVSRFIVVVLSEVAWPNILCQPLPSMESEGVEWTYIDALFFLTLQLAASSGAIDIPQLKKLIDSLSQADWCSLTAANYTTAVDWFRDHAPAKLMMAEPNTVLGRLNNFLQVTAGINGNEPLCRQHCPGLAVAATENTLSKQVVCVRVSALLLVHGCPTLGEGPPTGGKHHPAPSPSSSNEEMVAQVTAAVHRLITTVLQAAKAVWKVAGSAPSADDMQRLSSHESAMWNECFLLLRNAAPGQLSRVLVEAMCSWLQAVSDTDDSAESEADAWLTLVHVQPMLRNLLKAPPALSLVASLTESLLTPLYLKGHRWRNNGLDVTRMWLPLANILVDCLDSRQWDMLEAECVRLNCFLTLRLLIEAHLVALARQEGGAQQLDTNWHAQKTQSVLKALRWMSTLKIKTANAELRALPLIRTLLMLMSQEALAAPQAENRVRALRHVLHLLPSIENWSQDRSGSGLLGKIGLGKWSSLTPQFRLLMKSLYAYLLAQCPSSGSSANQQILRLQPNEPGAIPADLGPITSRMPNVPLPTNQAMQAAQKLRQLTGSEYQSFEEMRNLAMRYITRPENAFPKVVDFLDEMVEKLYRRPLV